MSEVRSKVISLLLQLFYCFLAHLLGRCLLGNFLASVPNKAGFMEMHGLSLQNYYIAKWNRRVATLSKNIWKKINREIEADSCRQSAILLKLLTTILKPCFIN